MIALWLLICAWWSRLRALITLTTSSSGSDAILPTFVVDNVVRIVVVAGNRKDRAPRPHTPTPPPPPTNPLASPPSRQHPPAKAPIHSPSPSQSSFASAASVATEVSAGEAAPLGASLQEAPIPPVVLVEQQTPEDVLQPRSASSVSNDATAFKVLGKFEPSSDATISTFEMLGKLANHSPEQATTSTSEVMGNSGNPLVDDAMATSATPTSTTPSSTPTDVTEDTELEPIQGEPEGPEEAKLELESYPQGDEAHNKDELTAPAVVIQGQPQAPKDQLAESYPHGGSGIKTTEAELHPHGNSVLDDNHGQPLAPNTIENGPPPGDASALILPATVAAPAPATPPHPSVDSPNDVSANDVSLDEVPGRRCDPDHDSLIEEGLFLVPLPDPDGNADISRASPPVLTDADSLAHDYPSNDYAASYADSLIEEGFFFVPPPDHGNADISFPSGPTDVLLANDPPSNAHSTSSDRNDNPGKVHPELGDAHISPAHPSAPQAAQDLAIQAPAEVAAAKDCSKWDPKKDYEQFEAAVAATQCPCPAKVAFGKHALPYELVCLLGRGSYGAVYKAVREGGRQAVALKVGCDIRSYDMELLWSATFKSRGDNICTAFGWSSMAYQAGEPFTFVLYPLADGDLGEHVLAAWRTSDRAGAVAIASTLVDVLQGLAVMHAKGVVHHDIKSDNVLVFDGKAKVADLGLAEDISAKGFSSFWRGTRPYMAPEKVRREPVHPAADVFAVGAMAFNLMCGDELFWRIGDIKADTNARILAGAPAAFEDAMNGEDGHLWVHPWGKELRHFILMLCQDDWKQRPTALEAADMARRLQKSAEAKF